MQNPVYSVIPLALINEIVAVPAQEVAPRSVKERNPLAASRSRADKLGPLSPEVAGRPGKLYRLLHVLPRSAESAPVAEQEDYPLWAGCS